MLNRVLLHLILSLVAGVLCLAGSTVESTAQMYFHGMAGYAVGVPSVRLGYERNLQQPAAPRREVLGSLGSGLTVRGGVGYMFSRTIGVEFAATYTDAPATDPFVVDTYSLQNIDGGGNLVVLDASMLTLTPSLVVCFTSGAFVPYARAGVLLAFPRITMTTESTLPSHTPVQNTVVFTGGSALGAEYGIGARVQLAEALFATAECRMASVSWGPEQQEREDGSVVVRYDDSYAPAGNGTPLSVSLQPRFPMESMAITLGVMYRL